jgi:hypothetical protein
MSPVPLSSTTHDGALHCSRPRLHPLSEAQTAPLTNSRRRNCPPPDAAVRAWLHGLRRPMLRSDDASPGLRLMRQLVRTVARGELALLRQRRLRLYQQRPALLQRRVPLLHDRRQQLRRVRQEVCAGRVVLGRQVLRPVRRRRQVPRLVRGAALRRQADRQQQLRHMRQVRESPTPAPADTSAPGTRPALRASVSARPPERPSARATTTPRCGTVQTSTQARPTVAGAAST